MRFVGGVLICYLLIAGMLLLLIILDGTGAFRYHPGREGITMELSIDSTNRICINVHGVTKPKGVPIHDVDMKGRTAAREIIIGNVTITMFECDTAPEDTVETGGRYD